MEKVVIQVKLMLPLILYNISSSETLTRIELIGAGGGDGGTDSGQGNSTTTGPAGRYIVDIELTNTTIKLHLVEGVTMVVHSVSGSVDEVICK